MDGENEIVVGLDLSSSSALALHWAAGQARRTGARLPAVHALKLPLALGVADIVTYPKAVSDDRVEASYREAVSAVWDSIQPEPDWRLQVFWRRARAGLCGNRLGPPCW